MNWMRNSDNAWMIKLSSGHLALLLFLLAVTGQLSTAQAPAQAQEESGSRSESSMGYADTNSVDGSGDDRPDSRSGRPPTYPARVSYLYQPTVDLDSGGDFESHRAGISLSKNRRLSDRDQIAFRFSYIWNHYSWNSGASTLGADPWSSVHLTRLGASYRRVIDQDWTFIGIPNVRLAGESDTDAGDTIMGGGILGATYKVNDRLSIGPGFGLMTQLEDDASMFPVIFIQWRVAEEWSIGTTGGSGAALGPGIQLNWNPANKPIRANLNAHFEKLRFRLDSNAPQINGIGQDQAMVFGGTLFWSPNPKVEFFTMTGIKLSGEISIEDARGNGWRSEDYDPAPYFGIGAQINF